MKHSDKPIINHNSAAKQTMLKKLMDNNKKLINTLVTYKSISMNFEDIKTPYKCSLPGSGEIVTYFHAASNAKNGNYRSSSKLTLYILWFLQSIIEPHTNLLLLWRV